MWITNRKRSCSDKNAYRPSEYKSCTSCIRATVFSSGVLNFWMLHRSISTYFALGLSLVVVTCNCPYSCLQMDLEIESGLQMILPAFLSKSHDLCSCLVALLIHHATPHIPFLCEIDELILSPLIITYTPRNYGAVRRLYSVVPPVFWEVNWAENNFNQKLLSKHLPRSW